MQVEMEAKETAFRIKPDPSARGHILRAIQQEQREWAGRNFPNQAEHHPIMGVVEEVGELCEGELETDRAKIEDSLGDIFVYALNVCNRYDFDMARLATLAQPLKAQYDTRLARQLLVLKAAALAGKISHHQLKAEQGIRGTREEHMLAIEDLLAELWAVLEVYALHFDLDLLAVLVKTWNAVMRRDWIKNSRTGGA